MKIETTGEAANSYVTEAQALAYLHARIPEDDAPAEFTLDLVADLPDLLIDAAEKVDELGFRGRKARPTQLREWPRVGALRVKDGVTPDCVRAAQLAELGGHFGLTDGLLHETGKAIYALLANAP